MSARATKAERRYWTADDIEALLVARYTGREYAYLSQVRNATGYSRRARTADAIVMSTWPSRGLLLMGFEIKVDRGDWLRELKEPEKAEEICAFCDRWWIVAPSTSIVKPEELPETWGLQVATDKGDALRTVKEPTGCATKAITREFLASMLRNAAESMVPRSDVQPRIDAATKAALEQGKRDAEYELKKLRDLQQHVLAFEEASGLELGAKPYRYAEGDTRTMGHAVRLIMRGGLAEETRRLDVLRQQAAETAERIGKAIEGLKAFDRGERP